MVLFGSGGAFLMGSRGRQLGHGRSDLEKHIGTQPLSGHHNMGNFSQPHPPYCDMFSHTGPEAMY